MLYHDCVIQSGYFSTCQQQQALPEVHKLLWFRTRQTDQLQLVYTVENTQERERDQTRECVFLKWEEKIWSLSRSLGSKNPAVPLSAPPRGLENFCCSDWICSVFLLHLFLGLVCFSLYNVSVFAGVCCQCLCFGFLQHVYSCTFLLYVYLFLILMCVFQLASFLKLQHVSTNGSVLGHCLAFALVGHRTLYIVFDIHLYTYTQEIIL